MSSSMLGKEEQFQLDTQIFSILFSTFWLRQEPNKSKCPFVRSSVRSVKTCPELTFFIFWLPTDFRMTLVLISDFRTTSGRLQDDFQDDFRTTSRSASRSTSRSTSLSTSRSTSLSTSRSTSLSTSRSTSLSTSRSTSRQTLRWTSRWSSRWTTRGTSRST